MEEQGRKRHDLTQEHNNANRHSNDPKESVRMMLHTIKMLEILAKVPRLRNHTLAFVVPRHVL
jgi:hypothetical protein